MSAEKETGKTFAKMIGYNQAPTIECRGDAEFGKMMHIGVHIGEYDTNLYDNPDYARMEMIGWLESVRGQIDREIKVLTSKIK